jgi:hypothetical protein
MAKRKKNESIEELRKRADKGNILDTKAGEMMLDLDAPVEGRTIEGLLTLKRDYHRSDNITVSWRIPEKLMKKAKEIAREEGAKKNEDIHYQKLIMGCFIEKYSIVMEK